MILQVTLTVAEAKKLIARAAVQLPETKYALEKGKIILKGGTTVSALAEELTGNKLGICGRITSLGTKGSFSDRLGAPHCVLIEKGEVRDIDANLDEEIVKLQKDDLFVTGANAIDIYGNAAIMAGSPLGGLPCMWGVLGEGAHVLILAGLEKLIPTSIAEAIKACGRKKIDCSFGMAVGLIPLCGKLITEREAMEVLAAVKCTVIGMGGINGAEGATTMAVEGEKGEIKKIIEHLQSIKGAKTSGTTESLMECKPGGSGCAEHLACIYNHSLPSNFWDK